MKKRERLYDELSELLSKYEYECDDSDYFEFWEVKLYKMLVKIHKNWDKLINE